MGTEKRHWIGTTVEGIAIVLNALFVALGIAEVVDWLGLAAGGTIGLLGLAAVVYIAALLDSARPTKAPVRLLP